MSKTNVPKIRFKDFTDAWEQRTFNNLYTYAREGGTPNTNIKVYYQDGIIPFAKIDDTENKYIYSTNEFITELGLKNSSAWIIPENNILFTNGATIGNTAINKVPLTTKQGILGILIKKEYDLEFVYYLLNSTKFKKDVKEKTTKGTFETIYLKNLDEISTLVSSNMKEQYKISRLLSLLDNLISLHQRKYEKLKNLKKYFLEKLFPKNDEKFPKLRFKNFTNAWEQRELGNEGTTFTGLFGKTKNDFGYGKAKFVTYINVFKNTIADSKMLEPIEIDKSQNEIKYGDIFFTTSSETPEEVGMSAIWLEKANNVYLNSFCFGYRLNNLDKYNLNFLAYNFRANNFRKNMVTLAQGISRYNISKNKVMEIKILIPNSLYEQTKIGIILSKLDHLITLHQRKYELLKKLKISFLNKMFI